MPYYSGGIPPETYQPPQQTALQNAIGRVGRTLVNPYVRTAIDALYTTYKFSRPQFSPPPTTPQVLGYPTSLLRATALTGALAQVAQLGGSTPDAMRQYQRQNYIDWARGRTAAIKPASAYEWKPSIFARR